MIIGVLGKGGSGKSTISAALASYLNTKKNMEVLAVDADHNMDFLFRLGAPSLPHYLGDGLPDLLSYCGLEKEDSYRNIFSLESEPSFSINPPDTYTEKYSLKIRDGFFAMAGGPHTEAVLYDQACSHALSTPLKVYLPFLSLKENQFVVVDEKAGSDGAGTGIASGFDYALIVLEPTPFGIKAAHQIADLLEWFEVPHDFVVNKVFDAEDEVAVKESLKKNAIAYIKNDKDIARSSGAPPELDKLFEDVLQKIHGATSLRKERSIKKIKKNETYTINS